MCGPDSRTALLAGNIFGVKVNDRFWANVNRQGPAECWLWIGTPNDDGYGRFWVDGKRVRAHRFAYEELIGPIPDALELDHVKALGCRSRLCVNPAHLEPVTHRTNTLRSDNPAALAARATECKNGHPYTSQSTYLGMPGRRICRICNVAAQRRRTIRKAALQVA